MRFLWTAEKKLSFPHTALIYWLHDGDGVFTARYE
jgi:hypothetical protein